MDLAGEASPSDQDTTSWNHTTNHKMVFHSNHGSHYASSIRSMFPQK